MNKIFANNTLLKILSFIIAIVLWAYIIIIIDAPTEKTFRDVPITTVNEQVISDRGYSIEKLSVQTSSVKNRGAAEKLLLNLTAVILLLNWIFLMSMHLKLTKRRSYNC